jgi:hypothetical protein
MGIAYMWVVDKRKKIPFYHHFIFQLCVESRGGAGKFICNIFKQASKQSDKYARRGTLTTSFS